MLLELALSLHVDLDGEAEIGELVHAVLDEGVRRLDVAVDVVERDQLLEALEKLSDHVDRDLLFEHAPVRLDEFFEVPVPAVLDDHVLLVVLLEILVEPDDVVRLQLLHDAYFCVQGVLQERVLDQIEIDDLDRDHLLRLEVVRLVDRAEGPAAEKFIDRVVPDSCRVPAVHRAASRACLFRKKISAELTERARADDGGE